MSYILRNGTIVGPSSTRDCTPACQIASSCATSAALSRPARPSAAPHSTSWSRPICCGAPLAETHHVVVDGSNLATEGRTFPSLAQLDEAVRAYSEEDPDSRITVVVDASFGDPAVHRAILLWLFQDLVLWLVATDQIKTFRPRRN